MNPAAQEQPWPVLGWRIGVEAELLAPVGSSRATLAERLAADVGGSVTRFFHAQTEPSLAPGVEVFDNLTLGFRVLDADGRWRASCVDDLTLQDDLDRSHPPQPGWFRLLSDDRRLLHLTIALGTAEGSLRDAMAPVAAAFGTAVEEFEGGMMRVCDVVGAPVLLGAPLPGERERPCELVTAPLDDEHGQRLDALLAPARALGFCVPRESATHIHFDASALRSAHAVRNLVRLWVRWGSTIKTLIGTNPACRQLGGWPPALMRCVESPGFARLPWPEAQAALAQVGLTKFCDLNLLHLASARPAKDTVEVRVLPGCIDTLPILMGAALFEALLRRAIAPTPVVPVVARERGRGPAALLAELELADEVRAWWQGRG